MTIVAICGPAGSGKSTLRTLLRIHYGYTHQPFAYFLKNMLRTFLRDQDASEELIDRMLDGDLKGLDTQYFSMNSSRYTMEKLGTEWRDMLGTNLWIDAWQRRKNKLNYPKVVIDDLRFSHEIAAIKKEADDTIVVRLSRAGYGPGTHPSARDYITLVPDIDIANSSEPISMLHTLEYWAANNGKEL